MIRYDKTKKCVRQKNSSERNWFNRSDFSIGCSQIEHLHARNIFSAVTGVHHISVNNIFNTFCHLKCDFLIDHM